MGKPDSTLGGLRYAEPLRRRRRTAQRARAELLLLDSTGTRSCNVENERAFMPTPTCPFLNLTGTAAGTTGHPPAGGIPPLLLVSAKWASY